MKEPSHSVTEPTSMKIFQLIFKRSYKLPVISYFMKEETKTMHLSIREM
jgi:hypothetical protein